MDRSTRTLTVVVVAVLTACGATYGVYTAIQRIPVRQVEVAHSYIVVAAKTLPVGALVTALDVKLAAWPERNPVAGSFSAVEGVVNRGVIAQVLANEPVTESKLAPVNGGAGLPPTIPQGMRAISVRVNDVVGVAGFVIPGTHVDVLLTMKQGNDNVTRVVVSNVQVLTAGTRYDQDKSKNGEPIPSSVVTLLLTPEDAARVVLAGNDGSIMLALRNPLDVAPTSAGGARTATLFGGDRPQAPQLAAERRAGAPARPKVAAAATPIPAAPEPPVKAKAYLVEAIRAAKRTEEALKKVEESDR
jgi:pilus assembly protein CpaB